jgi:hypothetical protein
MEYSLIKYPLIRNMIGGTITTRIDLLHSITPFIDKTRAVNHTLISASNMYNEESGVLSLFETAEPMIEKVNELREEDTDSAGRFVDLDSNIKSVIRRLVNIYKAMEDINSKGIEGIPSVDLPNVPNLEATDEWGEYEPDEYDEYNFHYMKGEVEQIIDSLERIEEDEQYTKVPHNFGGYRNRTHRNRTHRKRRNRNRTHCKRNNRKRTHRKRTHRKRK